MITKYIKLSLVPMLVFSALFIGCSDDDINNFDKTPTERLEEAKSEMSKALLSAKDGWKMIYFTDNNQFGGYTHIMKFEADGKVKMISDFDNTSITPSISDFELKSSYAPALVFTTKNKIHLLSDSNNSPGAQQGAGYKGDFEFVFDKIDEKGDIHFRTSRNNVKIVFQKAKAEDWTSIDKNFKTEDAALVGTENDPFFSVMEIKEGNKVKSYMFSYNKQRRFMDLSLPDPLDTFNDGYGIGLKDNSIVLNPAVKVGNEELSEFFYDTTSKAYVAKGSQGQVSLKFTDEVSDGSAFELGNTILQGEKLVTTHIKLFSGLDGKGNTPYGKKMVADARSTSNGTIARIFLMFNLAEGGEIVNKIDYYFSGNVIISHYVDIVRGENNAVILKHKKWSTSSLLITESLRKLDNHMLDPKGLLFKRENYNVVYPFPIVTLKAVSSLSSRKTAFALSNYDSTAQN